MTAGKEILVRRTSGPESNWVHALLEHQRDPVTRCELVDDWPDAPPEWPPVPPEPKPGAFR